jgi:miniconductance mechanosensitive channel
MVEHLSLILVDSIGFTPGLANVCAVVIAIAMVVAGALVTYLIAKSVILRGIHHLVKKSSAQWDDALAASGFFVRLVQLVPIILIYAGIDRLVGNDGVLAVLSRLVFAVAILMCTRVIGSLLAATDRLYALAKQGRSSIRSYVQALKIIVFLFAAIFIVATILNKSPWGLFSLLGGLTAVLLLVFKDTILGFVASVQLSGHDMVRIGDWIAMPKYGADGDVIDVTVNTVKVQNWDKTITTIPTYALISDAFQNWRGMSESGGRRIKRCLFIDMSTIRFCTPEMLERFGKIAILQDYVSSRQKAIDDHNEKSEVDLELHVNGRRQTNIGVFRAYVNAFLRAHPMINQDMTFLVRHLEPTSKGLPLQVYVFSSDQAWANYEAIQADIFDHLLAAIPEFELRVFQEPGGRDVEALGESLARDHR